MDAGPRSERRSGVPGLDRSKIVVAALRVLDREGLDRLSLRRVAQELGVAAPALYWHFRDKQELLDHMVNALSADVAQWEGPASNQTWDDRLAERARRQRLAMLTHRDSARLVAGTRPTAAVLPLIENWIEALAQVGFTPGQALRAVLVLGSYVVGFVLDEQAEAAREADESIESLSEAQAMFRDRLGSGELPHLTAAFTEVGDPNNDAGFEYGLRLIIDGLRAQLTRNTQQH